jgi:predicted dehydrogenase
MSKPLNIALIGSGFMGRAHSNGWLGASRFFDLPRDIILHTVCALDIAEKPGFAKKWGWRLATTSFKEVVANPEIDLIDIGTPNDVHREQAMAALEAGKHVACEKPLAGTMDDARAMRDASLRARRKNAQTFVWFNYRRCPAVAFAHQLVKEGRLGRIYHVRAQYLQDWGGPQTPLLWRFQSKVAGSGAHGDLNAHIIDMARFITGDEIVEITGAIEETFIKMRDIVSDSGGEISGKGATKTGKKKQGKSDVDDAVLFLARFKEGAVGSFEATRLATGNQNRNTIEVNGEKGSIKFDFERMNELQWWDNTLESKLRGWSRIMCTSGGGDHPYASAYWPPAHLIGYEHCFISQAADIVTSIAGADPVVPLPDFEDAFQTQRVLHAAIVSARERRPVRMSEVK